MADYLVPTSASVQPRSLSDHVVEGSMPYIVSGASVEMMDVGETVAKGVVLKAENDLEQAQLMQQKLRDKRKVRAEESKQDILKVQTDTLRVQTAYEDELYDSLMGKLSRIEEQIDSGRFDGESLTKLQAKKTELEQQIFDLVC